MFRRGGVILAVLAMPISAAAQDHPTPAGFDSVGGFSFAWSLEQVRLACEDDGLSLTIEGGGVVMCAGAIGRTELEGAQVSIVLCDDSVCAISLEKHYAPEGDQSAIQADFGRLTAALRAAWGEGAEQLGLAGGGLRLRREWRVQSESTPVVGIVLSATSEEGGGRLEVRYATREHDERSRPAEETPPDPTPTETSEEESPVDERAERRAFARAQYDTGQAHFRAGRFEEAIAAFERSIEARPEDPRPVGALGYAWLRLGDAGRALDSFDRALEMDPTNRDFTTGRSIALAQGGAGDDVATENRDRAIVIFIVALPVSFIAGAIVGALLTDTIEGIVGGGSTGLLVGATAGVVIYNYF